MAGDEKTESFSSNPNPNGRPNANANQRNPIMDALATYLQRALPISAKSPGSAWKQIAKAASDIKTVCPDSNSRGNQAQGNQLLTFDAKRNMHLNRHIKHWARCDDARKPGSTVAETEEEAWARKAAEERKSWGLTPAN